MYRMKWIMLGGVISIFNFTSMAGAADLDINNDVLMTLPKTCFSVPLQDLTFDLPIEKTELTFNERKQVVSILKSAFVQRCTLQIQYDGVIQQIIRTLFENTEISDEQLKAFYDQLLLIIQEEIKSKIDTTLSIKKILSAQKWQKIINAYINSIKTEQQLTKQQMNISQSYEALIKNENPKDPIILPLLPSISYCHKNNPQIEYLEQIMLKLPLTNIQEEKIRKVLQLQNAQVCDVKHSRFQILSEFFKLLSQQQSLIGSKQYNILINKLMTQTYLQNIYQLQALSSLFYHLTPEQKEQLREKYILLKGLL